MANRLKQASEVVCAYRMRQIEQGRLSVQDVPFLIEDIAERYSVRRDTVYKGVKAQNPLFPEAHRKGAGPKAWLHFTPQSIRDCDARRIAFYRTTPSWHRLFGDGPWAAPPRRSAKDVIATLPMKREKPGGTPG